MAVMEIGNTPTCEVVPESTPVEGLSVMPVGNGPVSDHAIVPMPPDCVKVWLNATPAVPLLTPGLVTVMVWQVMTRLYVAPFPAQPLPSATCTTIPNVPVCVGVPLRRPEAERVRPVGRVEAVVNVAPPTAPLCENCSLNGALTVPLVFAGL